MSHDADRQNSTDRLFTIAWNGSRSPQFKKFARDLSTGADAQFLHEDDHSIWQAMTDVDQGGQGVGAEAMPTQMQAGFTNATRRRKKRQNKAYAVVYNHIDNDRLKELMASE